MIIRAGGVSMPSLLQSTANTRQVLPGSFRYLRSDAPTAPTDEDIRFLLTHQVTLLIDLRSDAECQRHPCPLARNAAFTYRHRRQCHASLDGGRPPLLPPHGR